jgi:hypothetical protein
MIERHDLNMFQTRSIEYHAVKGLAVAGLILSVSVLSQRVLDFFHGDLLYTDYIYEDWINLFISMESIAANSLLFVGSWGLCRHHSWARRCLLIWGFSTIVYTIGYTVFVPMLSSWNQTHARYSTLRPFLFYGILLLSRCAADIAFPLIAMFVLMNREVANTCVRRNLQDGEVVRSDHESITMAKMNPATGNK